MTKPEIYRALADGKATSVQRLGSDGMYGEKWRTADSDFMLIDWLASDADWFDEARYRFKPSPKLRTIRAEELPPFFYVNCGGYVPALVDAHNDGKVHCPLFQSVSHPACFDELGWASIAQLIADGATYSEHHTNGPWLKFEVEDK